MPSGKMGGAPRMPSRKVGGYRPASQAEKAALVIGLGDSWFHYFAIDIFDALQTEEGLEAVSLAEEGTTLVSMHENPAQLLRLIDEFKHAAQVGRTPAAILLSAGGNERDQAEAAGAAGRPRVEAGPEQ